MKHATGSSVRDPLETYLREIRQYPVLSAEEERKLARTCRPALVTANLRFVVKLARGYVSQGVRLGDLIQEGNMGLIEAVERFDPDRGIRLVSYARWWIRAYIQAHLLRSRSLVKMGTAIARLPGRDVSLDAHLSDSDEGGSPMDALAGVGPPHDEALSEAQERRVLRARVGGALAGLDPRERYLVEQRLMTEEPETLKTIGAHFGISDGRALQLEQRARRKLEAALRDLATGPERPAHAPGAAGRPRARAA